MEFLENETELNKTLHRLGKTHKFRKVEPKNFEVSSIDAIKSLKVHHGNSHKIGNKKHQ